MINNKLLQLLTISSLVMIPAQTVFAMPDCYFMDRRGKVINLGFLCNAQITFSESSPTPENQTPTPTSNQAPGVKIDETTPSINEDNQNIPPNTPIPTNRNNVPTF